MVVPQAFTQPVYVTVTKAIGYAGLLGLASGGACWSRRMTLGRWIGSARSSRMVLSYQMDADIPTASRDAHAAVSSATLYPRTRLQNHQQPRGAEHADEP